MATSNIRNVRQKAHGLWNANLIVQRGNFRTIALLWALSQCQGHKQWLSNYNERKMDELEANIVNVSLRIDGDPEGVDSEVVQWAEEVVASV